MKSKIKTKMCNFINIFYVVLKDVNIQRTHSAVSIFILMLFLFLLVPPVYAQLPFRILPSSLRIADHLNYVQGECIIQFTPNTPIQERERVFWAYGLMPIQHSIFGGFDRVAFGINVPTVEMINALMSEPSVISAEPNYLASVYLIPNDPYFRYQWNMVQINAHLAWDINSGTGVTIAVLDSGVAYENFDVYAQAPDLAGTLFVPGWDFVNADANPDDDYGHGTHITGTIAQTTNNAYGCSGVAFNSSVMPVKVLNNLGNGTLTDVLSGIYYAANNGAKILNLSFGFGNNPSLTLQNAVQYADSVGCVIVCASGNDGTSLPNYPASYPECISVSAVRYDETLPSYSNYGLDIDLCAPGGDQTVDQNLDGYPDAIVQQSHDGVNFTVFDFYGGEGTSWASAHVSAVSAMIASVGGTVLTPLQIRGVLESTAIDLGIPGWDEYFGWGEVDAYAAIVAAQTGATVLSASPLVPFTPFTALPSPSPAATILGSITPFQPILPDSFGTSPFTTNNRFGIPPIPIPQMPFNPFMNYALSRSGSLTASSFSLPPLSTNPFILFSQQVNPLFYQSILPPMYPYRNGSSYQFPRFIPPISPFFLI